MAASVLPQKLFSTKSTFAWFLGTPLTSYPHRLQNTCIHQPNRVPTKCWAAAPALASQQAERVLRGAYAKLWRLKVLRKSAERPAALLQEHWPS